MTTELTIGDTAPDFSLADADGRTHSKSDFAGRKVIVYFYPKAATHDRGLRLPRQPVGAGRRRLRRDRHLPR